MGLKSHNPIRDLRGTHVIKMISRLLWLVPGRFELIDLLGGRGSLRSVVFHNIAEEETHFTKGLGVTVRPQAFEELLRYFVEYYTPVAVRDVIESRNGRSLPRRPILVTFDDSYASVADVALPICQQLKIPAAFFVNAAYLDNRRLALDNLICYVINTKGLSPLNAAIQYLPPGEQREVKSLAEVFSDLLPATSIRGRDTLRLALARTTGVTEVELAAQAGLYLTSKQLQEVANYDCEIGNHTYYHTHCRCIRGDGFVQEIDNNRDKLESLTHRHVRTFSLPYGSVADLTEELVVHLKRGGYEATFLSSSVANRSVFDVNRLDRVSVKGGDDADAFSELEVLPRLRRLRNGLAPVRARRRNVATSVGSVV